RAPTRWMRSTDAPAPRRSWTRSSRASASANRGFGEARSPPASRLPDFVDTQDVVCCPLPSPAMKCPRCKQDNDRVVDSRAASDGSAIRRRRECLECYLRYTTYERVEETPLRVIKKSGERVRFERERVMQ